MEYQGKEIVGELLRWQEGEKGLRIINGIKYHQRIKLKCTSCNKISDQTYKSHRMYMFRRLKENSNFKYMCHACGNKIHTADKLRGRTLIDLHGKEKAELIRSKLGSKGEKNGMFGKPSPQGSGNGWSGWYKGWYFRSLRELSFMINYIERFNFKWQTLENKKHAIPYINYEGTKRNYFPDFLLNDKYIIEIKPKKLWSSIDVLSKSNAAELYCSSKSLKYKIIDPKVVSSQKILDLHEDGKIKFLPKYEEKFKLKYLNK